jgi:hypothetical protein
MAKEALASEDLAKKFATEKETPYTRWVKAEGLDIIPALYVRNLRTVDVKPWARRGGNAVFVNHDASRVSNDSYVMEIPPGKTLEPHRQLYEEMILVLEGQAHHLRVEGGLAVRHPAQRLASALQWLGLAAGTLCRRHQCAAGDQPLRGSRLHLRLRP